MILDHKAIALGFSQKVYPNPGDPAVKANIEKGMKDFEANYLGQTYPYILAGESIYPDAISGEYVTRDPNDPDTIVGHFRSFTHEFALQLYGEFLPTILAAGRKFHETVSWQDRVRLLAMISEVAQERFWLLCAAKAYETGQSIAEQIGETDEEVDFPLANAVNLERMHCEKLIASPEFSGDYNGKRYVHHGVFANFSPFNFPGAIPMDMATKALAMGNAFIEKSSDKASLCGYLVFETIKIAFERCGIDWRGVVNYMPGGADVASALLLSPDIAGLSFTGSTAVLKHIRETYGKIARNGWAGQAPLVYGSAETSGVNVFIVTKHTDVKRAAVQYVKSFIGRQGQKCSSARIAFVDGSVEVGFIMEMRRVLDEVRYGDVKKGADMGAMITKDARDSLLRQIDVLCKDGVVSELYNKSIQRGVGHDFAPMVLRALPHVSSQIIPTALLMNTEFFGPVSTIVPFGDLAQVRSMCAQSRFALTGAFFTDKLDEARQILSFIPAGNVYGERKCTGALVETECFGGLRSASSPSGIKGIQALALFGSMQTLSGFYPSSEKKARRAWKQMLEAEGFVLSKS
jgi:acyl-CoA reductase-like NAD-dependent aldehyde dehydrogenase